MAGSEWRDVDGQANKIISIQMITADISNLETKVEVKYLTSINDYVLSLFHFVSTSLCSLSQTFPYMPPYMECFFFNTRECPMCGFKGKQME